MTEDGRRPDRHTDEEQLATSRVGLDHASDGNLSDEDAATLRHVRFGALPARIRPAESVETVDAQTHVEKTPYRTFDVRQFGDGVHH